MTGADVALIVARLDDISADIQSLTTQVKETNGRVRTLESWQQYVKGGADTLAATKAGRAWIFPAMSGIVGAVVGSTFYVILSSVFPT